MPRHCREVQWDEVAPTFTTNRELACQAGGIACATFERRREWVVLVAYAAHGGSAAKTLPHQTIPPVMQANYEYEIECENWSVEMETLRTRAVLDCQPKDPGNKVGEWRDIHGPKVKNRGHFRFLRVLKFESVLGMGRT